MTSVKTLLISILTFIVVALIYARDDYYAQSMSLADNEIMDTSILKDEIEIIGTATKDDPWREMDELVKAYYTQKGIEYKGTINVIDDNSDEEKIIEQKTFEYTLLDNEYHYLIDEIEMISNNKLLVAIDHASKAISVSKQVKAPINRVFDIGDFKNIMLQNGANARVTRLDKEKILTIDSISNPGIQGYRIYYSPETYKVNKILIGMSRSSQLEDEVENSEKSIGKESQEREYYYYLEVLFKSFKELNIKRKDFKPEEKFLMIKGDNIKVMPEYKDYQLLSSLSSK